MISSSIFKAYDIRGIVGRTLDADTAQRIGRAFGSEARARGGDAVAVARDGRLSGPELAGALTRGIRAAGVDVFNLGQVPTPVADFATHEPLEGRSVNSCVVVTGSHNPPEYNGFNMVLRGAAMYGERIQALRERIEQEDFSAGRGSYIQHCEVDGRFPNHHPDPAQPENLRDVIQTLAESEAQLGFAFDGDGDRLGVVT